MRPNGTTFRTCLKAVLLMSEGNDVILVTPSDFFNHHLDYLSRFLGPLRSCIFFSAHTLQFAMRLGAQPHGSVKLRSLAAFKDTDKLHGLDKRRLVVLFDDCLPSRRTEDTLRAWGVKWQQRRKAR